MTQSFHDLKAHPNDAFFVPGVFGFRIHGKQGSQVLPVSAK